MRVRVFVRLLLTLVLAGPATALVTAAPVHAAACGPTSAAAWDSCSVLFSDATAVEESVEYTGPAGTVKGRVCRPTSPGPHPVLVMNHGAGQDAFNDPTIKDACRQRAREGWFVLASNYRLNEYGTASPTSDVCLGEVDDVVAMIEVARTVPAVDDSRITVRGLSLGGCVTLQLHQRGLPGLVAAATINGMSDVRATRDHARAKYNQFLCVIPILHPLCQGWSWTAAWIENATGGVPGPATQPAYDARSPIARAVDTAASEVPLALMQGANDQLIPAAQTCALVAAVNAGAGPAFTPVHYGTRAAGYPVLATPAVDCPGVGTWHSGAHPYPTFPEDRYLAVVDGLGHNDPALPLRDATDWVDAFLAAKL